MIIRFLRRLARSTSGNAMMFVGLGMPMLVGAAGYGVDTAQWYMWQRELQHSVDQAAIGGAWALVYDESADYAKRAEQEFFGNQAITEDFASEPEIQLTSYDGGAANSVLVTASVTRQLPFTGLLLSRAVTVTASAQAAFKSGGKFNACLITLRKDGTTFKVGGSAHVIANCGLGALSCSDNAIVIDGSATVETTAITTCGTADVPPDLEDSVTENVGEDALYDAYGDLPIPAPTGTTPDNTKKDYCVGNGNNAIANLKPGIMTGGYVAKCATNFAPGVYFIDGGTLDLSTNATVVGHNVLFVLRKGAELKLGGQGGGGSITLSPMGVEIASQKGFAGEDAERLARMLFIEDKTGETEPAQHQVNGNSRLNLEGILYLPNGDVQVNGDSGTTTKLCFQISAYTLDIRGSAYLRTLCEAEESTELGEETPTVRLVA
ncbi:pilus assembly protein [Altererythrobacter soli]|uniref:Pilus assembly protein n=2 Tax=Croceibacterium soli TaxID=1739690 RepID=A0A6I4UU61_9SPHN|nr:pilus assembly protein [Croceibacterium soli]